MKEEGSMKKSQHKIFKKGESRKRGWEVRGVNQSK